MDYTEIKCLVTIALKSHPDEEMRVIADILLALYTAFANVIDDKKERKEAQ